jgi:hypothetical protein
MREALVRHVGSWLFYFCVWVREEYLRVVASWEGSIYRGR